MRTVSKWYELLPQPFRGQAIENHKAQAHRSNVAKEAVSLESALEHGFIWGSSKEGIPHWNHVYNSLDLLTAVTKYHSVEEEIEVEGVGAFIFCRSSGKLEHPNGFHTSWFYHHITPRTQWLVDEWGEVMDDETCKILCDRIQNLPCERRRDV